jgi:hypothetical protein
MAPNACYPTSTPDTEEIPMAKATLVVDLDK